MDAFISRKYRLVKCQLIPHDRNHTISNPQFQLMTRKDKSGIANPPQTASRISRVGGEWGTSADTKSPDGRGLQS